MIKFERTFETEYDVSDLLDTQLGVKKKTHIYLSKLDLLLPHEKYVNM